MIKLRSEKHILFGVSRANLERLMKGGPIFIEGAEVGLEGLSLSIVFGETEKALCEYLAKRGVKAAETLLETTEWAEDGSPKKTGD